MATDAFVYFIDNHTQEQVLDMAACVDAIERGYQAWGRGDGAIHPKNELHTYRDGGYHNIGLMHGSVGPMGLAALRIKSDNYAQVGPISYGDKHAGHEGQFCGLVLVFSTQTGLPLAILNDGYIQHTRVAAGGAVAAKYLAREDSQRLCILGSGGMARGHAEAIHAVRPISSIAIYSPTKAHREECASEVRAKLGVEVEVMERAEDAVKGADIVALCTNSVRASVLKGEWLEPGMHVTGVLGAEMGPDALEMVDFSVKNQPVRDLNEAFAVAGAPPDGVTPRPQGWKAPAVTEDMPLLSDVVLGRVPGRIDDKQITYFSNNEGTGIQFAAAARVILDRLADRGFEGVNKAPLAWFVQDIRD